MVRAHIILGLRPIPYMPIPYRCKTDPIPIPDRPLDLDWIPYILYGSIDFDPIQPVFSVVLVDR